MLAYYNNTYKYYVVLYVKQTCLTKYLQFQLNQLYWPNVINKMLIFNTRQTIFKSKSKTNKKSLYTNKINNPNINNIFNMNLTHTFKLQPYEFVAIFLTIILDKKKKILKNKCNEIIAFSCKFQLKANNKC